MIEFQPVRSFKAILTRKAPHKKTMAADPLFGASKRADVRVRYTDELQILAPMVAEIMTGAKQSTVRLGEVYRQTMTDPFMKMIPVGADRQPIPGQAFYVEEMGMEIVNFGDLTEEHARKQSASLADLKESLNNIYGSQFPEGVIPDDYPMTVIDFEFRPELAENVDSPDEAW